MNIEQVGSIIDKTIIEKGLNDGKSFLYINSELYKRADIIFNIIKDEYKSMYNLLKSDITNKSVKEKYVFFFIKYTAKRVNDIHWIINKKDELKRYNNIELFGLLKLKDKLENGLQEN